MSLKEERECSTENCSESRPHCLDFHHTGKENKDMGIEKILENGNMEELKSELKKCELLCANCHQAEHFADE